MTRDGGFVRDGEVPPFTPPPEVTLHYIEGMVFSLEVTENGNGAGPRRKAGFGG